MGSDMDGASLLARPMSDLPVSQKAFSTSRQPQVAHLKFAVATARASWPMKVKKVAGFIATIQDARK
jgi:hypothetical protein